MRTLRQLSYASTATLLTSVLVMGCSGDAGENSTDGQMANPATTLAPDGTVIMTQPDGTVVMTQPDGTVVMTQPDGTVITTPPGGTGVVTMPDVPPDGTTTPVVTPVTPVTPTTPVAGMGCEPGISATSQVPRLLNREYDNAVRDLLGVTTLANGNKPSSLLNADYDGPMDTFIWNAYQDAGSTIAAEVIGGANKANFISCDPATVATCYEDTIRAFGRKAFRRAVTQDEVDLFMALTTIEPAGTPDQIAGALLNAFLVSPSFIMVTEMASEPSEDGAAIKLSSNEIATRLSLMLWGSVPDQDLMDAADADMLQDPVNILIQANRMVLDRAKTGAQVASAHRSYLVMDEASHWWKSSHESPAFPGYSDAVRPAMQAELDKFFEEIAFTGGSFKDVFLSNIGFVNADTAPLYGLDPAGFTAELQQVELTDRPGFLTRVGFLSSFTNAEVTSPILRGAFITVQLIGVNPGAPDPDALKTPIPDGVYTTRRQQIEALTEPSECTGCHTPLVNPPGFALENYDPTGKWQDTDPLGGPIDATATVTFTAENIKPITGAQQLMEELANNPESRRLYAERIVSYATGRLPNPQDACAVNDVTAKLDTAGYNVLNALADLTQADSFRLRTVGN